MRKFYLHHDRTFFIFSYVGVIPVECDLGSWFFERKSKFSWDVAIGKMTIFIKIIDIKRERWDNVPSYNI